MRDIICNGCSLLCDDGLADIEDGKVVSLGLCRLGHAHLETSIKKQNLRATVREDGKVNDVTLDEALEKAVTILTANNQQLLYGWTNTSNEAITEGLALASTIKGTFDTLSSMGAVQDLSHELHKGKFEIDLDYARNYGEFIIYWGSDPAESLHRHPSRFAVLPRGEKIPEGIESRTIGVVDVRETETMKMANHRMIFPAGLDAQFLDTLTAEISGTASISSSVLGIPASEVLGFIRAFQKSDCTVIFYGSGLINSGHAKENLTALADFLNALRKAGKTVYALPMFTESNTIGTIRIADKITSNNTLRDIVDKKFSAALIVGDDVLSHIPGPAARALAQTELVYIGPIDGLTSKFATVSIQTPEIMISGKGTMHRIDDAVIEFDSWQNDSPNLIDVLRKLHDMIKAKLG